MASRPAASTRVSPVRSLSIAQARRVALAAQGFARPRPASVSMRQIQQTIDTLGVIQIDSVNVLSRAHYLPFFARLGAYDRTLLDRAVSRAPRRLVEYWAHEASLIPPATRPLLSWRMAEATGVWPSIAEFARTHPDHLERVYQAIARSGPMTAAETERHLEAEAPRSRDNWGWNWSQTKYALEYLFYTGSVTSAGRNSQFERRFDLPERVLPAVSPSGDAADAVRLQDAPSREASIRALVEISARALGVGTLTCLRDYFRLKAVDVRPAIASLVHDGVLLPTEVRGWSTAAYLHRDARIPRSVDARALLVPFDPLIFERTRLEALFGMRYRIEIYTPKEQRVHGYYVLPFLLGEDMVARVDLKADRSGDILRVQASHLEAGVGADRVDEVAMELAAELALMARWLGLASVVVEPVGDLAGALASASARVVVASGQP